MNETYQMKEAAIRADGELSSARTAFLVRTYNHLFGAIAAFTLLEIFFFKTGIAETIARALLGVNWLLVLGGFIIVSWFASRAAYRAKEVSHQYLALGAFVLAEAIIFVPLLYIANYYAPGAISSAALVTILGFAGLTFIAFKTKKNFSFLGGLVRWGLIVALLGIVASVIFGLKLGTWFSVGMVGLAGAAILYDTSKIIRSFPEDRHVAAALELFASVALMFWYVLRLFISRD
jgi:FtsH-binding integral membrane protein